MAKTQLFTVTGENKDVQTEQVLGIYRRNAEDTKFYIVFLAGEKYTKCISLNPVYRSDSGHLQVGRGSCGPVLYPDDMSKLKRTGAFSAEYFNGKASVQVIKDDVDIEDLLTSSNNLWNAEKV